MIPSYDTSKVFFHTLSLPMMDTLGAIGSLLIKLETLKPRQGIKLTIVYLRIGGLIVKKREIYAMEVVVG